MRARVRMRRDHVCRNVAPGQEKTFTAGGEYILVWWEATGKSAGIWGTDYDLDEAWLVPADAVEVLKVLEP